MSTQRAITRELARYAANSRYDALPDNVRAEAVRSLVNFVGCALGGCNEPSSRVAASSLTRLGGSPQATILGHRQRTDVANAAFVNCISSSCQAFDDAHLPTVAHPSSPAGAAVLAMAELQPVAGPEFLNALALAIDLGCRLSNAIALPPSKFNPAFFLSGVSMPIAVALAAGNLLRLNEDKLVTAIALAAAQGCGFRALNGTMSAHFRPGNAARAGIWAAMLAAEGFTSDDDTLETDQGFFSVYAPGADLGRAVDGLGQKFELFDNAYKPYPCGIVIHPSLDACLEVKQQAAAGARPVDVKLTVHPFTLTLCALRTPATEIESHVSLYHWVAATLLSGSAGLEVSKMACINDPEVAALRARIEAVPDPTLSREEAIAEVTFSDGQRLRSHVLHVRGSASRPMTDGELDAKFLGQARTVLAPARADELLALCRGAAAASDVGRQVAALAAA